MSAVDELLQQLHGLSPRSQAGVEARRLAGLLKAELDIERDESRQHLERAEDSAARLADELRETRAAHLAALEAAGKDAAQRVAEAHRSYELVHHDRGVEQVIQTPAIVDERGRRTGFQPVTVADLDEAAFRFRVAGAQDRTPVRLREDRYGSGPAISCDVHLPLPATREEERLERRRVTRARRLRVLSVAAVASTAPLVVLSIAVVLKAVYGFVIGGLW